jgi:hypothetical protein
MKLTIPTRPGTAGSPPPPGSASVADRLSVVVAALCLTTVAGMMLKRKRELADDWGGRQSLMERTSNVLSDDGLQILVHATHFEPSVPPEFRELNTDVEALQSLPYMDDGGSLDWLSGRQPSSESDDSDSDSDSADTPEFWVDDWADDFDSASDSGSDITTVGVGTVWPADVLPGPLSPVSDMESTDSEGWSPDNMVAGQMATAGQQDPESGTWTPEAVDCASLGAPRRSAGHARGAVLQDGNARSISGDGVGGGPGEGQQICSYPGCSNPGCKYPDCSYPGCKYTSTKHSHLTRHSRTHTRERPYRCAHPGCGYAAAQNSHLKTHVLTHSAHKGFSCHLCTYASKRKEHLKRHVERCRKNVHGQTARAREQQIGSSGGLT